MVKKFLRPPNLIKTQAFQVHKLAKIVMIGKHKDFVLAIFKIMPPCFEGFNNSKKLNIVSFVSSFGWNHLL